MGISFHRKLYTFFGISLWCIVENLPRILQTSVVFISYVIITLQNIKLMFRNIRRISSLNINFMKQCIQEYFTFLHAVKNAKIREEMVTFRTKNSAEKRTFHARLKKKIFEHELLFRAVLTWPAAKCTESLWPHQ